MLLQCSQCPGAFTSRKILNKHVRTQHGEVAVCPHDGCSYLYPKSDPSYLERHRRSRHQVLKNIYSPLNNWQVVESESKKPKLITSGKENDGASILSDISSPESISLLDPEILFPNPPRKVVSLTSTSVAKMVTTFSQARTTVTPSTSLRLPSTLPVTLTMATSGSGKSPVLSMPVLTTHQSSNHDIPAVSLEMATVVTATTSVAQSVRASVSASSTLTTPVVVSKISSPQVSGMPLMSSQQAKQPLFVVNDNFDMISSDEDEDHLSANIPHLQLPGSSGDTASQVSALSFLTFGCMPLMVPAMRAWEADEVLELCQGVMWPPKGWKHMTPDKKLLNLEFAAMMMERHHGNLPAERHDLVDKYNMLALPGTAAPAWDKSQVCRHMRYYNFKAMQEVAQRKSDPNGIMPMFRACFATRSCDTDKLSDSINKLKIPIRLYEL